MIEESEVSEMIKQIIGGDKEEPVSREDFKRYYLDK
jgi:hypothetical protein